MSDVSAARIPALMLTYDADLDVTLFCLDQYARHWPDCPLRFLAPVNSDAAQARLIAEAPPQLDIQAVSSPGSVGATLRTLLAHAGDVDWIYWANADRYPYALPDPDGLSQVVAAVTSGQVASDVPAVRLTRWLDSIQTDDAPRCWVAGQSFRSGPFAPFGFWHHHLLRREWLVSQLEGAPEEESLYDFHVRVVEPLGADGTRALIPDSSLIKFEEPIIKGDLTLNYLSRLERRGRPVPERTVRRATTAYASPRIAKDNRFWEKAEKAPSLAAAWPTEPVTVISYGGVGSKALVRWLSQATDPVRRSRAHTHRRIPPPRVGAADRLVYVFGDPREAVLSIFNRRIARHERHGFEPDGSTLGRADFAICHAINLEADPRPMTEAWDLETYLDHGVDLFRLQEHFDFWRYADGEYPILFVRYETLDRTAPALAKALGLERPPFEFSKRTSRLGDLDADLRRKLDALYGDFAGELAALPDLFEVQGTTVRPIGD